MIVPITYLQSDTVNNEQFVPVLFHLYRNFSQKICHGVYNLRKELLLIKIYFPLINSTG